MWGRFLNWLNGTAGDQTSAVSLGRSVTVTNTVDGQTLHLGDGRTLEYGESVEVTPELAALLMRPAL
jgi:hypothetical protein